MNLNAWVDVAIGLIVVYLGASLFVTVINEYIAQALNLRGEALRKTLRTLIDCKEISDLLKQSPAISAFFQQVPAALSPLDALLKALKFWKWSLWRWNDSPTEPPSYVDPNVLARMLVGRLAASTVQPSTQASGAKPVDLDAQFAAQLSTAIGKLQPSPLKSQIEALAQTAGKSADEMVKAVSDWADRSLSVLGEGYKRNLQKLSLAIGLAVAVVLNLDTWSLTEHLYRDKDAREATVAVGVEFARKTNPVAIDDCLKLSAQERKKDTKCVPVLGLIDAVQKRNETLGHLPIGWSESMWTDDTTTWARRIFGWLLTAFAVSLGAPFWFDLLSKLVNMRHGMRRPEIAPSEKGKS